VDVQGAKLATTRTTSNTCQTTVAAASLLGQESSRWEEISIDATPEPADLELSRQRMSFQGRRGMGHGVGRPMVGPS